MFGFPKSSIKSITEWAYSFSLRVHPAQQAIVVRSVASTTRDIYEWWRSFGSMRVAWTTSESVLRVLRWCYVRQKVNKWSFFVLHYPIVIFPYKHRSIFDFLEEMKWSWSCVWSSTKKSMLYFWSNKLSGVAIGFPSMKSNQARHEPSPPNESLAKSVPRRSISRARRFLSFFFFLDMPVRLRTSQCCESSL